MPSECPNGCHTAEYGTQTVREREETVALDSPRVGEMYGETYVVTEHTERYAECRVCGWRVDL